MTRIPRRPPWSALLAVVALLAAAGCDLDMIDDDDYPDYEGPIDMDSADIVVDCIETDPAEGLGVWEISTLFEGWAGDAWVELWALGSDYCEGFDVTTGDPCSFGGQDRPGWYLENYDYGYDDALGFWDEWILDLPFSVYADPPEDDASWFGCGDEGNVEIYVCACDDLSGECFCAAPVVP